MARQSESSHLPIGKIPQRIRVETLKEIRDATGMSAAQMSGQGGFPSHTVSRFETGVQNFTAAAAVQFAGQFRVDFREFMHEPKHDAPELIERVIDDLRNRLTEVYRGELNAQLFTDDETRDAAVWEHVQADSAWRRAQTAADIVIENDRRAGELKTWWDTDTNNIQVELIKLRGLVNVVLTDRIAGEEPVEGDVRVIKKRGEIETLFERTAEFLFDMGQLPHVLEKFTLDPALRRSLQTSFMNILADWGDEAALQVMMAKQEDDAEGQGAFNDAKAVAAIFPDLAKDRVTPAPPPPANAAQANTKDLPTCGEARAGRDGFHLPAGADAMSYISRPYFLADVGSAYAVYANGESMVPRYDHGELLFVNPSRPPKRGDYVVIQIVADGEISGYVKKFKSANDEITVVQQFNPPMDIKFRTSDVKSVHLIVGSLAAGH